MLNPPGSRRVSPFRELFSANVVFFSHRLWQEGAPSQGLRRVKRHRPEWCLEPSVLLGGLSGGNCRLPLSQVCSISKVPSFFHFRTVPWSFPFTYVLRARSGAEHRELVRAWAQSTWDAWAEHHAQVRAWAADALHHAG